jgi:hypothetical protein
MCVIVIFAVPAGDAFNFILHMVCTYRPHSLLSNASFLALLERLPTRLDQWSDLVWVAISRLP